MAPTPFPVPMGQAEASTSSSASTSSASASRHMRTRSMGRHLFNTNPSHPTQPATPSPLSPHAAITVPRGSGFDGADDTTDVQSVGSDAAATDVESLYSPREPLHPASASAPASASPAGPVTWMSLPRKDQLFILFIGRLADFLQLASLQAYVFYQLKSFNSGLTDAEIATQAGLLQGCFTGAQVLTAILWGNLADARWCGRKRVLLVGLAGTAVSCLGFAFATDFWTAAYWRAFGGAINGTVGIIRTMISEITVEKKYQSRAFLLLPMSFNTAGILGPVMGGVLADPALSMPRLFGEGALFSSRLLRDHPFALPSLFNAGFLGLSTLLTFLMLEETSKARRGKGDLGLRLHARARHWLRRLGWGWGDSGLAPVYGNRYGYAAIADAPALGHPDEKKTGGAPIARVLPFRRLWTRNVVATLVTGAFYDFHLGAFTNLWSLFLSTPRFVPAAADQPADQPAVVVDPARAGGTIGSSRPRLPWHFTGGLGMPAATVGAATSLLGLLGMALQFVLYPRVQARLGTLRSFRVFLPLFAAAYFAAPYLAVLPSSAPAPQPAGGPAVWTGIVFVLLLQVTARTFTLPASIILLNNCSPHPSVLGTVHGLGQSVSAAFRTVGPIVSGWWYGAGLGKGMVGWSWWGTTLVSVLGTLTAAYMHDGSGHEIRLEGEEEEEKNGREGA